MVVGVTKLESDQEREEEILSKGKREGNKMKCKGDYLGSGRELAGGGEKDSAGGNGFGSSACIMMSD